MDWQLVIHDEFIPISGVIILLTFLMNNTKMDRIVKQAFYKMSVICLIDCFSSIFIGVIPQSWRHYESMRSICCNISFILRPFLIYYLSWLSAREYGSRVLLNCLRIPYVISTLTGLAGLYVAFSPAIPIGHGTFYYDQNAEIQVGTLGYIMYGVVVLYSLFLGLANYFCQKKRSLAENILFNAVIVFLLAANVVDYFFGTTEMVLTISIVMAIIAYYIIFQNRALLSMIDDIPGSVIHYSVEKGRIQVVSFNTPACRLVGYSRREYEEVVRKDVFPRLNEEGKKELQKHAELLREQDETEGIFLAEWSGKKRWIHFIARVYSRTKDKFSLYAVITDVTQRKEEQEALLMREQELSVAMSEIGKVVIVFECAAKTITMPESYAKRHGYAKNSYRLGETWKAEDGIREETFRFFAQFLARITNGEKQGKAEGAFPTSDGKICYERADFVTLFDWEGKPNRAYVFVEDVTEEHERKKVFEQYKNMISGIVGSKKLYLELDFIEKRLLAREGSLLDIPEDVFKNPMEYFAQYLVNRYVHQEDADFVLDFFNRSKIMGAFAMGRTHRQFIRMMQDEKGKDKWIKVTLDLEKALENGHFIARIFFEDVDDEHRKNKAQVLHSNFDALTGGYSSVAVRREIESFLSGQGKRGTHAFVLLTLAKINELNERLGYWFGDQALQNAVKEFPQYFQKEDIFGRVKGSVFALFIKDTTVEKVTHQVRKLLQALEVVYSDKGIQVESYAQAGISMYRGDVVEKTYKQLHAEADAALYKSKMVGQHSFTFADEIDALSSSSSSSSSSAYLHSEAVSYSLRNLLNNIAGGVAIFHKEPNQAVRPSFCNDALLTLMGLTNEQYMEYLSKDSYYGIHPDDLNRLKESVAHSIIERTVQICSFRLRKSETEYRHVVAYTTARALDNGHYDLYVIYFDVESQSVLRRIQSELDRGLHHAITLKPEESIPFMLEVIGKAMQAERAYIFEQMENGDSSNTYEWVADGVTPGKDTLQNVSKEVLAPWYKEFENRKTIIIRDIEELREETPILYKGLKRQEIRSLVVVPIINEEKEAVGFIGIDNPPRELLVEIKSFLESVADFLMSTIRGRDLLRQLDVKNKFRLNELLQSSLFQTIMDETDEMVFVVDLLKHDIMYMNGVAEQYYHKKFEDGPWKCFDFKKSDELCNRCLSSSLQYGEEVSSILLEKDRHIRDHRTKVNWEGHDVLIVFRKDITEEIQRQNLENELKVEKQTNHMRSEFFSRLSHDIRTPINAIVGMTHLAQENILDRSKVQEHLGKILSASQILLQLLNNALDTSALERGKITITKEPFNLEDILRSLSDIFLSRGAGKEIKYISERKNVTENYLIGDSLRVTQIGMNLLSNAVKFIEKKGEITVIVEQLESDEKTVRFRFIVKDTGCGISDEFKKRMFHPFEQQDSQTPHIYGGNGLGLYIVHELVKMMGGSIRLESEVGVGSTFIVELPFEIDQERKRKEKMGGNEDRKKKEWDFSGCRFLIADDDLFNREVISGVLEMTKAEVDKTEDGQQAVETFAKSEPGRYTAILLDVHMPKMNGHEAARAIRGLDRPDAQTIPIFALTADVFPEDVKKALDCGMTGHLAKPIEREKLYEALEGARR